MLIIWYLSIHISIKSNYHAKQQSKNNIYYHFHRQGNGSFGREDMQTLFTEKSEVVKLAFGYIDKAHINPSEAPESVKSELAKINKRQDDIIRFIRHYEEEQLNPMIRASNSIAVRFNNVVKALEVLILSQLEASREKQTAVLKS